MNRATSVGALVPWGGACLPITHPEAVYELRQFKRLFEVEEHLFVIDMFRELWPNGLSRRLFLSEIADVPGEYLLTRQKILNAFDRAIEQAKSA